MADFHAEGGAGGNGHRLDWRLDYSDTADTVTINAEHTKFDGSPQQADPQQAQITFQINSGASIGVNLLNGLIVGGGGLNGTPFDGTASKIIGSGSRTRTNVRLRISADRAAAIFHSTQYQPPA